MSPSTSVFGAALGAGSDPRILQLKAKFIQPNVTNHSGADVGSA